MRIRWTYWLAACLALAAPVAHAQDYDPNAVDTYNSNDLIPDNNMVPMQEPGTVPSGTTTTTTEEVSRGVFASPFTVTPAVGALGFGDAQGNYTSRITEGLLADLDLGGALGTKTSRADFGIQTGLLYSHVGATGSNFWGSGAPDGSANQGTNSFLVPIELAVGWSVTDSFKSDILLGANMLYRSIGSEMLVGRGDADTNSLQVFPSVGLQAGWALGPMVALTLRGDYIPTPAQDMFTAAIGATFPLA